MQHTSTISELTSAEAVEIQGGDGCAEFAKDVGYVLGAALQLIKAFGDGASGFDWATMK